MGTKSTASDSAADAAIMVPVSTLADAFDLTPRRVQQLAVDGIIPKAERGRYPLIAAVKAYVTHVKASPLLAADDIDPAQARARKDIALAVSAEIKNDIALGKVVLIGDAIAIVTAGLGRVRNLMLGLGTRVAPRLVSLRQAEPIRAVIHDEVLQILQELSVEGEVRRLSVAGDDTVEASATDLAKSAIDL